MNLDKFKELASAEEELSKHVFPIRLNGLLKSLQALWGAVQWDVKGMCTFQKRQMMSERNLQTKTGLSINELTRNLCCLVENETTPRLYCKLNEKHKNSVSVAKAVSVQSGKKNEYHEGNPCINSSGGLVPCFSLSSFIFCAIVALKLFYKHCTY